MTPMTPSNDGQVLSGESVKRPSSPRMINLDPDFRRSPKTRTFCALCQKDLRTGCLVRHIFTTPQVSVAVHPADVTDVGRFPGDFAWYPIGMQCAHKIGLEWSRKGGRV